MSAPLHELPVAALRWPDSRPASEVLACIVLAGGVTAREVGRGHDLPGFLAIVARLQRAGFALAHQGGGRWGWSEPGTSAQLDQLREAAADYLMRVRP